MKIGQICHPSNGVQMVEVKNDLIFLVEDKSHQLMTVLDFIRYSTESGAKLEELVEENRCSNPLPLSWNEINNSPNNPIENICTPTIRRSIPKKKTGRLPIQIP